MDPDNTVRIEAKEKYPDWRANLVGLNRFFYYAVHKGIGKAPPQ